MFNNRKKETVPRYPSCPPPPPPYQSKKKDAARKIIPVLAECGIRIEDVHDVLEYVKCFVREQQVTIPETKEVVFYCDCDKAMRITVDG